MICIKRAEKRAKQSTQKAPKPQESNTTSKVKVGTSLKTREKEVPSERNKVESTPSITSFANPQATPDTNMVKKRLSGLFRNRQSVSERDNAQKKGFEVEEEEDVPSIFKSFQPDFQPAKKTLLEKVNEGSKQQEELPKEKKTPKGDSKSTE